MAETKITDLVPRETIEELINLRKEMGDVVTKYEETAMALAKGLRMEVKVVGDLDSFMDLVTRKTKEANEALQRGAEIQQRYQAVVSQTTPVIARQLMEVDKANRATQQQYNSLEKAREITAQYNDTLEGQAQRVAQLTTKMAEVKKSMDNAKKAYKEGVISLDEYNARNAALILKYESLKQEKAKVNQLMTAEIKMNQSGEESYIALSQQLEIMKKTYKDMSSEMANSEAGQELLAQINELDSHLKDLAGNMGEFQRNVGNYAIAGQNGVVSTESLNAALAKQALTTKDLQDQNKILAEAKLMLKRNDESYASTVEQINAKIEENNKALGINTQQQESAKKGLKDLVLEISNLTLQYQSLSEEERNTAEGKALASHIQELTEKAGKLKDAISDTNRAISNAASDTRGFDQLTEGAQLAADTFGLVQGTAAALGITEGDLQEVQTKLLAAITLSNAASKVQNALQKESAIMQGVLSVQTRLRTVAENLHTAAQGRGVVMTKLLTAAQWAFNAAANANPIGLLVVAITALIAAGYGLIKVFKLITGDSETVKKAYEDQVKSVNQLIEANDRLIEKLKARGATEAELLSQAIKNHQKEVVALEDLVKKAEKLYGKDSDQYKEAFDRKKEIDQDFKKSREDAHDYIDKLIYETNLKERENAVGTYQVKRELIEDELRMQRELLSSMLEIGEITYEQYTEMLKTLELRKQMKLEDLAKSQTKTDNKQAKDAEKAYKELQDATRAGEDALLNIIDDSIERQRKAEQYRYDRQLADLQRKLSKLKSTDIEMRTALNNQIEGLEAEHAKKLREIENTEFERRLNAQESFINSRIEASISGTKEELDANLELLKVQQSREYLEIKNQEENHTITKEQAEEMRANIVEKYVKKEIDLWNGYYEKQADLQMKNFADEQAQMDADFESKMAQLKAQYAEEISAHSDNERKKAEITEEYEKQVAEASAQYAVKRAQATVNALKQILKSEELTAEDRKALEQQLTKAEIDLVNAVADANIQAANKSDKGWQDGLGDIAEGFEKWGSKAMEVMNAVNDLLSSIFDSQIQKIEEQQEANDEANDRETEKINELVEKQVITKEEGEARKRAADAKTAKENEKLEKKKAELTRKQAIFQKATDLAQAGISTAVAILNALATQPFMPLGLAMAAIAGTMGAIQMATIAATPIPQYKEGTPFHFGGPAIVGDGGKQEVVLIGSKAYLTPDTPTLIDLPKGAEVIPSIEKYLLTRPLPDIPVGESKVVVNNDYTRLERKLSEVADLIRMQTRQNRLDEYQRNYEIFKATRI